MKKLPVLPKEYGIQYLRITGWINNDRCVYINRKIMKISLFSF